MASKDKDGRSLQDKLKDFFKKPRNQAGYSGDQLEHQLPEERLRDLGRDSPLAKRLHTIKELKDYISGRKLETSCITKLWASMQDLFGQDFGTETRHIAFQFVHTIIRTQYERLQIMRSEFFRFIKAHNHHEDIGPRLELFNCLTDNGKNILYFEEGVGPFLLTWFPDISKAGRIMEYLLIVDNVIRFNAAYLSEDVIAGFLQHICVLCNYNSNYDSVMMCLKIMSNIVAYSNMSNESLPRFIGALCRTGMVAQYWNESWKTMKNLLGTHMGHATIYTMCKILQEPSLHSETILLRGAVTYIYMSLWSRSPLTNLHCPPSSVLPSMLDAVKSNQPSVAYEVTIGIHQLVQAHGEELLDPSWSLVLEILLQIHQQLLERSSTIPNQQYTETLKKLHDTLTAVEQLLDAHKFNGSVAQFYALLENCANDRPEASVLRLVNYLAQSISPIEHRWLCRVDELMRKYFRQPVRRTTIRCKVLEIVAGVIKQHGLEFEDQLIDTIIITHLSDIDADPDVTVRKLVAEMIVDLCHTCTARKSLRLLEILDKLLLRPFKLAGGDMGPFAEAELMDVCSVVSGLVGLFVHKFYTLPSSCALRIYEMLVTFLHKHYARPKVFSGVAQCRLEIFQCFLKMRADSLYRLGCPDSSGNYKYSPYLTVYYPSCRYDNPNGSPSLSPAIMPPETAHCPPMQPVSLKPAFKMFMTCLNHERDWTVLRVVLTEIPKALQNKSLILSRYGNADLHLLVNILHSMLYDKNMCLPDSLNIKVTKPDFQAAVLGVLVNLASYHSCLDQAHQQKVIRCLMRCIQSGPRSSKQCISALTICVLEMREVMVKVLGEVLLNLSKISATVHIAIPVLEFLSTLTQLPRVFANFVADQYMAVFAISLPYTNPFKYNHYTVSLAHHVIAVWFLKCRLPFRKDFVKFITNGLQTNVLVPFEETSLKTDLSNLNEDSSDRKRSTSLTDQSTRRRTTMAHHLPLHFSTKPTTVDTSDKGLLTFYEELTETCIDLMARYAFSPCSALPRRLPGAEFLLNGGQSMCWLIGNKLVTVTTSGCSQKVLKHGLCDKCWTLCSNKSNMRTRSGSNEHDSWVTRQNSNDNNTSLSSPIDDPKSGDSRLELVSNKLQQLAANNGSKEKPNCACWCQGWAEVYVRRPTGDMSWVMRIQNQVSFQQPLYDFPLNEISTLFMPSLNHETQNREVTAENSVEEEPPQGHIPISKPIKVPDSPIKRQNSLEDDLEGDCLYDEGGKSRNPVRRSNSSPEMSGNWKNPFMQPDADKLLTEEDAKKSKMYKDMRVSCVAIPEEKSGTTPPSNEHTQHPVLMSCHSCPGERPSNLSLAQLSTKPPQSPTQTRYSLDLQKSSSSITLLGKERARERMEQANLEPTKRDRTNTIAVMNPASRKTRPSTRSKDTPKSGINPSFVFLQLYHAAYFGSSVERPLLVSSDVVQRAVRIMDSIPPYETHKIGVLYIKEGQTSSEVDILGNRFGSLRYVNFLQNLGTLVKLSDVDPQMFFLGGLEQNGNDGDFAYIWQDDVIRVAFHVATMMPNKESEPTFNNKKLHIGNNYVNIVYNDSGDEFNLSTIKGQFNFASVVIQPLDHGTNKVVVKVKDKLKDLVENGEAKLVSDQNVAILVRQLALHCNLASLVVTSLKPSTDPYASNWLERLRKIKNVRNKIIQEHKNEDLNIDPTSSIKKQMEDFTDYT